MIIYNQEPVFNYIHVREAETNEYLGRFDPKEKRPHYAWEVSHAGHWTSKEGFFRALYEDGYITEEDYVLEML